MILIFDFCSFVQKSEEDDQLVSQVNEFNTRMKKLAILEAEQRLEALNVLQHDVGSDASGHDLKYILCFYVVKFDAV